jgi:hypothetical protein
VASVCNFFHPEIQVQLLLNVQTSTRLQQLEQRGGMENSSTHVSAFAVSEASFAWLVLTNSEGAAQRFRERRGDASGAGKAERRAVRTREKIMTWKSMRLCSSIVPNVSFAHRKAGRVLVLALAVAIIPATAKASSVNFSPAFNHAAVVNRSPEVLQATASNAPLVVDTALFCGNLYSCTAVNALSFTFAISAGSQGTLHFTNLSGVSWHNLTLTETGIAAADITCTSNIFGCSIMPAGANGARIVLTVLGNLIGVPAGQSFELGFGCKSGGCLAWPSTQFTADANAVPEPNSGVLALTGFGLLSSLGMLWRRHTLAV